MTDSIHTPRIDTKTIEALRARAERAEAALVARHGGEPLALLAELDAARAENARLREALASIARQCACRCDQSWTSRGRHSPDCLWHLQEEANDALAAEGVG